MSTGKLRGYVDRPRRARLGRAMLAARRNRARLELQLGRSQIRQQEVLEMLAARRHRGQQRRRAASSKRHETRGSIGRRQRGGSAAGSSSGSRQGQLRRP